MNARHYREWDYDAQEWIEFARHGECNGCAECCLTRVEFKMPPQPLGANSWGRNGGATTDAKGVWFEVEVDGQRCFYPLPKIAIGEPHACKLLRSDLKCSAHATKGGVCETWPINPKQVMPFTKCSFTFEEIGRGKI